MVVLISSTISLFCFMRFMRSTEKDSEKKAQGVEREHHDCCQKWVWLNLRECLT